MWQELPGLKEQEVPLCHASALFLTHPKSSSPALKMPRGFMLPFGSLNTPLLVASPISPPPKTKTPNERSVRVLGYL